MREVHWNKLARSDYYQNIDFLLRKWSEKEAQEFIDEVDDIEFILKQGKVEFQGTEVEDVKRCVIRRQISLFYKVIDKHNVELLRFWNNYQDPESLKL
ncbi:MAG: type II toxin-antitoxin system RelE/ParE family toxin [Bacteroidota bacterium]